MNGHHVLLFPGIAMPALRMALIAGFLRSSGYDTHSISYPSTRKTIEGCADAARESIGKIRLSGDIHVVGHSMGGLVALDMIARGLLPPVKRLVMIGTPVQGSQVADLLENIGLYKYVFGPAGQQLTTAYRAKKNVPALKDIEVGVIAGTSAWDYPFFLHVMNKTGPHDGLVSVESTKFPQMKDHICLPHPHSTIIEGAFHQVLAFLRGGAFDHTRLKAPQAKPSAL